MYKKTMLLKGKRIKTFGNSMFPLLQNGDIVHIQKVDFNNILDNDIIIFRNNDHYITHRVIYKTRTYVVTKGDNNLKADGKVLKKDIVGKVEKITRNSIEFHPEIYYSFQSSVYMEEIKKVNLLLQKNKILFVFLKGLPLHLYFEKNYPRRLYADCDILIYKSDLQKVRKLFLQLKYQIEDTSLTTNNSQTIIEMNFYKKVKNVIVNFDLHVEPVFMMIQLDVKKSLYSNELMQQMTETFLTKKSLVKINKIEFPILKIEYLIVYLALHFFHHNYKGIFRLHLLHTIINSVKNKPNIWVNCENFIKKFQLESFVYPVFLILNIYLSSDIPKGFIINITPKHKLQKYFGEKAISEKIFDNENRLFGGLHRLVLVLMMSPNVWYKKLALLFSVEVWRIFFAITKKIFNR